MVNDVSEGISFVCNNIADYGGDPKRLNADNPFFQHSQSDLQIMLLIFSCLFLSRIYLMGQSAGAHISSCALLEQAIKESRGESTSWSVSQLKAYFGLSGG